jgi:hypothetical protein
MMAGAGAAGLGGTGGASALGGTLGTGAGATGAAGSTAASASAGANATSTANLTQQIATLASHMGVTDAATLNRIQGAVSQMMQSTSPGVANDQIVRMLVALVILQILLGQDKTGKAHNHNSGGALALLALQGGGNAAQGSQGLNGVSAGAAAPSAGAVSSASSAYSYMSNPTGGAINVQA